MERRLLSHPPMHCLDSVLDSFPTQLPDPPPDPAPGPPYALDPDPELVADRPRERLWRGASHSVSDAELVSVILGTGVRDRPVLAVAADVVQSLGGVVALSRASPHELVQVTGIGAARAARLAAAFELGRRALETVLHRTLLRDAADVYRCVAPRLSGVAQEVVLVIGVDSRNRLLDIVEVARGGVLHVNVHPREVFRPLIRMAAAGGVLVHNHPSGDPQPSAGDRELTRQLRDAGHMLEVPLIDHVIIGNRSFRSLAEWMGSDF